MVISSLFQFMLAARLSLLRRIFTPTVAGVVIMLIAATVTPVIFASLTEAPEGVDDVAAPLAALTTLLVIGGTDSHAGRRRCGCGRPYLALAQAVWSARRSGCTT